MHGGLRHFAGDSLRFLGIGDTETSQPVEEVCLQSPSESRGRLRPRGQVSAGTPEWVLAAEGKGVPGGWNSICKHPDAHMTVSWQTLWDPMAGVRGRKEIREDSRHCAEGAWTFSVKLLFRD